MDKIDPLTALALVRLNKVEGEYEERLFRLLKYGLPKTEYTKPVEIVRAFMWGKEMTRRAWLYAWTLAFNKLYALKERDEQLEAVMLLSARALWLFYGDDKYLTRRPKDYPWK